MSIKRTYIVTDNSFQPTSYDKDSEVKEYTKEADACKEALRATEGNGGESWVWRLAHVASPSATIEAVA